MCVYKQCVSGICGGQMRTSDHQELYLQRRCACDVGVRTLNWLFLKGNKYSLWLSYLSSLSTDSHKEKRGKQTDTSGRNMLCHQRIDLKKRLPPPSALVCPALSNPLLLYHYNPDQTSSRSYLSHQKPSQLPEYQVSQLLPTPAYTSAYLCHPAHAYPT